MEVLNFADRTRRYNEKRLEKELRMLYRLPPSDGPYALVRFEVQDTGSGMDEKTRQRAFEPFFTTKGVGEGTGLGLSTVYGIARQAGGHVTIESTPGKGTTLRVWLPRAERARRDSTPSTSSERVRTGTETILVAEDEPVVSALVRRLLEGAGYKVLLAADGVQALELMKEHEGEVDLVVTDVVMPRMGGPELFRRLGERKKRPPVLFASGYTDSELGALDTLGEHVDLVLKPYSPNRFLQRVRAALDRKR